MAAADKYSRAEMWRWPTMGRHSRLSPVCAGETRGCYDLAMAAARQSSPSPHLRFRALDDGRTRHGGVEWSGVRRRLAMAHGNQPPPASARNPPPEIERALPGPPEIERRRAGMMPTRLQAVPTKSLAGANITSSMFSYIPFLCFACMPNLLPA
jgi:hypothetical protein